MSRYLLVIAQFVVLLLMLWGVGGFIAWDWNMSEWAPEVRFALVFFALVSGYVAWWSE